MPQPRSFSRAPGLHQGSGGAVDLCQKRPLARREVELASGANVGKMQFAAQCAVIASMKYIAAAVAGLISVLYRGRLPDFVDRMPGPGDIQMQCRAFTATLGRPGDGVGFRTDARSAGRARHAAGRPRAFVPSEP